VDIQNPESQLNIKLKFTFSQRIYPNPVFVQKIDTEFFIGCETISIKKSKEANFVKAIDLKSRLPIVGL
jgi:hypothetical protein